MNNHVNSLSFVCCWLLNSFIHNTKTVLSVLFAWMFYVTAWYISLPCSLWNAKGNGAIWTNSCGTPWPWTLYLWLWQKHYSERLVPQEHLWTSCWTVFDCLSMGGRASSKLIVQCKIYHLFYFLSSMCNCWFYSYSLYIFLFSPVTSDSWKRKIQLLQVSKLEHWCLWHQSVLPLYKLWCQAKHTDSELAVWLLLVSK